MQQSVALRAFITWHACSCLSLVDHNLAGNFGNVVIDVEAHMSFLNITAVWFLRGFGQMSVSSSCRNPLEQTLDFVLRLGKTSDLGSALKRPKLEYRTASHAHMALIAASRNCCSLAEASPATPSCSGHKQHARKRTGCT